MSSLNPESMLGGYLACALWTSEFGDVSIFDLPADTLDTPTKDVETFASRFPLLLDAARELGMSESALGHDL